MPSFAAELGDCLARVVEVEPPEPEFDAVRFFGQWLGERNLGLVPIADAASFSWPGPWIAKVRAGDEDHAVLMFGSPSGPVHDPGGAFAAGGLIVGGWVVSRLDVHLPIEPSAPPADGGSVAAILTAAVAECPLARVESARAEPGRGLEGDRYHAGTGTFSGVGRGYELTLVEAEALDEIGLAWEDARRNVVTQGIRLNGLVGRRFRIGEVECVGRRLAEPCAHLERLTRPGIIRPLVHRAGLRADILSAGTISVGDALEVECAREDSNLRPTA